MPGLKEKLKQLLLGYSHFTPSFSQAGEDMILRGIFRKLNGGFYVDVGAYHPVSGSNTQYFNKFKGWSGINIEPNPQNFVHFEKMRPKDINLNMGVSGRAQELKYYMIDVLPTMNSFSKEFIQQAGLEEHISRVKTVPTDSLKNILEKYAAGKNIDLMNIDVEGMDMEVLNSNDWEKYRPKCIVIEVDNDQVLNGEVHTFLSAKNYVLKGLTPVNTKINSSCIYLEADWIKNFSNY